MILDVPDNHWRQAPGVGNWTSQFNDSKGNVVCSCTPLEWRIMP